MLTCPVATPAWVANDLVGDEATVAWKVDVSCCTATDLNDPANIRYVAAAVQALNKKTCGEYGICEVEFRPCISRRCGCPGLCDDTCTWREYDLRDLTLLPIISIVELRIDGAVIPSSEYMLSGAKLIPLRDGALWSRPSQDMNLAYDAVGTWSIKLSIGRMPPELLLIAAAELACAIAARCAGQACELPQNAVSVTRDGVTIRLDTGFDAIQSVKMALDAFGCKAKTRRSRIVDPREFMPSTRV